MTDLEIALKKLCKATRKTLVALDDLKCANLIDGGYTFEVKGLSYRADIDLALGTIDIERFERNRWEALWCYCLDDEEAV